MAVGNLSVFGYFIASRLVSCGPAVVAVLLLSFRTFIQRKIATATNALCRQRWQYGYVAVYVSIAIYITNYQLSAYYYQDVSCLACGMFST